ncbi:MAG: DNA mismatch repair protein MutS [Planctomycetes bacterium]|nr:DNA mismatch repair protein MutS [Planctomycetota bacterium]
MSATPMMQQYMDAKVACGDALLLFRMGDFYELFFEDAKTAARVLGLTLTSREKGENAIPMAGFPHHQLESYLGKLIAAGHRAAVCDQVEDPKQAKGLVKREVTRVVSAGTLTDDALLDPRESNYLAAIAVESNGSAKSPPRAGLAWAELSTGRFFAAVCPIERLADHLARIQPAECLLSEAAPSLPGHVEPTILLTRRPNWGFSFDGARDGLFMHFGAKGLEGFGFEESDSPAVQAAGAVLDYLRETQKASIDHIDRLTPFRLGETLEIDEATRRSLELTRTIRDGRREGSLLAVIDRTVTAMGSRLLCEWLANPLTNIERINLRLDAVEELIADPATCRDLRERLKSVYDLERLLARVATGRASPRDLKYIGATLAGLPKIKAKLTGRKSRLLTRLETELDLLPDLRTMLDAALSEECPLSSHEGGFIKTGYRAELDSLRELAAGGKEWIARYQAEEAKNTGIPNLKVGYNKVFGYYLEVTNAHRDKAPDRFIRKQTLVNAERYITPELKEYEEKVLSAEDKAKELEHELFLELRAAVHAASRRLQKTAELLASLDVLLSLAELARERNYCRPVLTEEPALEICDGRHPVLDIVQPEGQFVPNDTLASPEEGVILLITGPNMAGKSTYIRQIALIAIMAQMGGFVPAKKAVLGAADRVFARVGASDELARGQSTFMVEMTETARILNTATSKSLVILDEIGRGTSTYDGVSLAWAIVEHLHDRIGCRTLFATHYHELTDLAASLAGVKNLNVSVREWEENVVFLHKIVPGAADKSYGIHVARLAGVPREVNERAKQILAQLEQEHLDETGRAKIASRGCKRPKSDLQLTLFGPVHHPLLDESRELDPNRLTPLEALTLIKDWRERLTEEPSDTKEN